MIALAGDDRLLSISNSEGDTVKQVQFSFFYMENKSK